jgi:hypothetical protein
MENHTVKIKLTEEDLNTLSYISKVSGSSRNETIRQALAISKYVNRNLKEGNKILLLKDSSFFELQFGSKNQILLYPPKEFKQKQNIFKKFLDIFKLKLKQ